MAVYVVTWNLNKERQNYDEARRIFIEQLEKFENRKDTGLESVRWISTTWDSIQINNYLRSKMDANDRLFISKVNKGERAGWIAKSVWEWIASHE